jgi:predicted CXXCH cytochrome family protein
MRGHLARRLSLFVFPTLVFVGLVGCTDETIVYRDRPVYDEPADGARGFVGYTLTGQDPGAKATACGNCHVGPTSQWEETDHADAWNTLEASGHAQEFCRGCHTVSELGNATTDPGGYNGSQDSLRYMDVQCESCHGEGLPHVEVPDGSGPLASMLVGSDLTNGCGECHEGTHHPFVEQWEQSAHGDVTSFAAGRDSCNGCHSGNGALVRWGITANYAERNDFLAGEGYMDITCGVCHDPHGGPNSSQLRFPVEVGNDIRAHLCAQCHDRRTEPDPGSSHGLHPHSPETALLEGTAGYFFPDMEISPPNRIVGTHGTEANERLCAGCHVDRWTVTDEATGDFQFQNVGHSFNAIPCLENGIDSGETECALTTEDRYFESCATSGCHGTPSAALGALQSAAGLNKLLAEEVHHLIEQVPDEIDPTDGVITTAEGAEFNYALAHFGAGRDGEDDEPLLGYTGSATHNPFHTRELLVASIEAMQLAYGLSASSWYEEFISENPDLLPRMKGQKAQQ